MNFIVILSVFVVFAAAKDVTPKWESIIKPHVIPMISDTEIPQLMDSPEFPSAVKSFILKSEKEAKEEKNLRGNSNENEDENEDEENDEE